MRTTHRIWLPAMLIAVTACSQSDEITLKVGVDPDQTIATVNGQPIPRAMIDLFREDRAGGDDDVPMPTREEALEELINMEVMAQAAVRRHLHRDPETAMQLISAYRSALVHTILEREMEAGADPDEAQLRQAYEEYLADGGDLEYSARHILVDERAEAQRLIDELNAGADFSDLAQRYSRGPRRDEGGGMGWLSLDEMLPGFDHALPRLSEGEHSAQPINTPLGWGILFLDDTRERQPPPFEDMRERLAEEMSYQRIDQLIRQLYADADIKLHD